jgi:hypothetical protein
MVKLGPYYWYILKHVSKDFLNCVRSFSRGRNSIFTDSLFEYFRQLKITLGIYKVIMKTINCGGGITEYRIKSRVPLMNFNIFSPGWIICTFPLCTAKYGFTSLLEWFFSITTDPLRESRVVSQTAAVAAEFGETECLDFIMNLKNFCWLPIIAAGAARGGQLEILKKLKEKNCQFDARVIGYAARHGYSSIIKWVRHEGLKWDNGAVCQAFRGGHISVLQLVKKQVKKSWMDQFGDTILYETIKFATNPAEASKWIIDEGIGKSIGKKFLRYVGKKGNTLIVDMLFSLNQPTLTYFDVTIHKMNDFIMRGAAYQGNIKFIEWARSRDPPLAWGKYFMANAIKNGKIGVVKWAISANPPYIHNIKSMKIAVKYKQFEIVKWLLVNGCQFNHEVIYQAAVNNHFEILKWAIENYNFQIGPGVYQMAEKNKKTFIINYLVLINASREYGPNNKNHVDDDGKLRPAINNLPEPVYSSSEENFSRDTKSKNHTKRQVKESEIYDDDDDDDDNNNDDDDNDDN